jgi:hypothetical protein
MPQPWAEHRGRIELEQIQSYKWRRRDTVPTRLVNKFNKRAAAIPPLRILTQEDNAKLVAAAKNGSNEAFEVLVRRHQARILSAFWRLTRNREDAEDIVQRSLQKAFVHLRQFEGNSSFSTWLTRIAINEAIMWLGKKRAVPEVPIVCKKSSAAPRPCPLPPCGKPSSKA